MTRVPMQAATRAGAIALVTDYASSAGLRLQVYPGRPRSINPPTAFVDRLSETLIPSTAFTQQRVVVAEVVVIHGLFDSLEAVTQKDAFVDGFVEWVVGLPHAIAPNTEVYVSSVEDVPNYIPDWLPIEQQRLYYATTISVRGYADT